MPWLTLYERPMSIAPRARRAIAFRRRCGVSFGLRPNLTRLRPSAVLAPSSGLSATMSTGLLPARQRGAEDARHLERLADVP
jgi:hypothetical protein